jgi:hypothetical protein
VSAKRDLFVRYDGDEEPERTAGQGRGVGVGADGRPVATATGGADGTTTTG